MQPIVAQLEAATWINRIATMSSLRPDDHDVPRYISITGRRPMSRSTIDRPFGIVQFGMADATTVWQRIGMQSVAEVMPMRSVFVAALVWMALVGWSMAGAVSPVPHPGELDRVSLDGLCVTNGAISTLSGGRLAIDSPSSRAVAQNVGYQSAEIRFRYLGPTQTSNPLASGELRRQIGIKLDAQDTCNLLYVMWHIEPDSRIAVSVKRNPGQHTHEQCGAHGYMDIKPSASIQPAKILSGDSHTLRADLQREKLTVSADGAVVWRGTLGNRIDDLVGPVGLRTDNARFEYFAGAVNVPEGMAPSLLSTSTARNRRAD